MGTTPNFAFPYPEPTDPVAAGAAAIRSLAEAVDARVMNTGKAYATFLSGGTQLAIGAGLGMTSFSTSLGLGPGKWLCTVYFQQYVTGPVPFWCDLEIRSGIDNAVYSKIRLESHIGGGSASVQFQHVVNGGATAYWYGGVLAGSMAVNTWVDPATNLFSITAVPAY